MLDSNDALCSTSPAAQRDRELRLARAGFQLGAQRLEHLDAEQQLLGLERRQELPREGDQPLRVLRDDEQVVAVGWQGEGRHTFRSR